MALKVYTRTMPRHLRRISKKAYLQRAIIYYLWSQPTDRFITAEQIITNLTGQRNAKAVAVAAQYLRGWVESRKGPGGGYRISPDAIAALLNHPADVMQRIGILNDESGAFVR